MVFIWQYGGCMMNFINVIIELIQRINWVWIGLILLNGLIWWSIFTNGFFTTLLWLIIGSSIIGIILKLKEDTRV